MKITLISYIIFLTSVFAYSQTKHNISDLKNQKNQFKLEIENLKDSINAIDLKIAEIKSEKFLKKIKDSSFTAIARKGAKLKKDSNVLADIITTFDEDKKIIIIDYKNGYFEICQNSLCGYLSEIWLEKNNLIHDFIKLKNTEQKVYIQTNKSSSIYSSSLTTKTNNSSYKKTNYRSSRTYYRGPRGGCYYINSNGNKTYVDRSLCN